MTISFEHSESSPAYGFNGAKDLPKKNGWRLGWRLTGWMVSLWALLTRTNDLLSSLPYCVFPVKVGENMKTYFCDASASFKFTCSINNSKHLSNQLINMNLKASIGIGDVEVTMLNWEVHYIIYSKEVIQLLNFDRYLKK